MQKNNNSNRNEDFMGGQNKSQQNHPMQIGESQDVGHGRVRFTNPANQDNMAQPGKARPDHNIFGTEHVQNKAPVKQTQPDAGARRGDFEEKGRNDGMHTDLSANPNDLKALEEKINYLQDKIDNDYTLSKPKIADMRKEIGSLRAHRNGLNNKN